MIVQQILAATLCLVVPVFSGIILARRIRNWRSLLVAPAVTWLVFLAFNLYSVRHSPDRQILQGTWLFFQLTEGTFVALLAAACAGGTLKLTGKVPNHSSKRTREKPRAA